MVLVASIGRQTAVGSPHGVKMPSTTFQLEPPVGVDAARVETQGVSVWPDSIDDAQSSVKMTNACFGIGVDYLILRRIRSDAGLP